MNFEEKYKKQKLIETYITTRKRIERLVLKTTKSLLYEQEKAISEYIKRLYNKQLDIEANLKYQDIIKITDDLSVWTTKEIRELMKDQMYHV